MQLLKQSLLIDVTDEGIEILVSQKQPLTQLAAYANVTF